MNIRGLTGSLFQFFCVVGGFMAVLFLGVVTTWTQGFLVPGYFGIAVATLVWFCPESPRFILDRKGAEAARPALQRVRQGDVTEELEFIDQCLQEERAAGKVSYRDLFTKPGLRKRLFVACYLQAAQQLTGVNAFLSFQSDIFGSAGYADDKVSALPGGPAIITQYIFLVGSLTGLFLIDSPFGGRKKQLLGASVFMGPPLVAAAICHYLEVAPMVTAAGVWVFSFGFQAAWGIIPWFYPAELFEMRERERALSISTFFGFAFNCIVAQATQALFNWSKGGMFMVYGLLNISNCIFVMVFIKETKGVPLEKVPALFGPVDGDKQSFLKGGD